MTINWHDWFYYDETSPTLLRWKVNIYTGRYHKKLHRKIGDVAGGNVGEGYHAVKLKGKMTGIHRIIWEMFKGAIPDGMLIDHIDGNGKNNNLDNLRICTHSENNRNRIKSSRNISGHTGVQRQSADGYWYWLARWRDINGKSGSKNFSIKKYGEEEAFRLACEYRDKMIKQMNEQGVGFYTERHGK